MQQCAFLARLYHAAQQAFVCIVSCLLSLVVQAVRMAMGAPACGHDVPLSAQQCRSA